MSFRKRNKNVQIRKGGQRVEAWCFKVFRNWLFSRGVTYSCLKPMLPTIAGTSSLFGQSLNKWEEVFHHPQDAFPQLGGQRRKPGQQEPIRFNQDRAHSQYGLYLLIISFRIKQFKNIPKYQGYRTGSGQKLSRL